jgi:hypothetical protein
MTSLFDLSNALIIQKQYLDDLGGYVATSGVYARDAAGDLTNLETKLNELYNAYSAANINSQYIIDNQRDMVSIVNEETQRLDEKKTQIDNKLFEANRMIYLNENYRKRQNAVNNMLITIIIAVIIFIIILYLKQIFPVIPEIIINILIILLISITIIIVSNTLVRLYFTRDNFDYDKIKMSPPSILNKKDENNITTKTADGSVNNLLSSINLNQCMGASCCTKPNVWDSGSGMCVTPNPDSGSERVLLDLTSTNPEYISRANCAAGTERKICGMTCMNASSNCKTEGFEVMPTYSLYKTLYG